jgi:hypothetical protein
MRHIKGVKFLSDFGEFRSLSFSFDSSSVRADAIFVGSEDLVSISLAPKVVTITVTTDLVISHEARFTLSTLVDKIKRQTPYGELGQFEHASVDYEFITTGARASFLAHRWVVRYPGKQPHRGLIPTLIGFSLVAVTGFAHHIVPNADRTSRMKWLKANDPTIRALHDTCRIKLSDARSSAVLLN